jgi:hypothetical protein
MIKISREQFTNRSIQYVIIFGNNNINTRINFSIEVNNFIKTPNLLKEYIDQFLKDFYLKDIYGRKYDLNYFKIKNNGEIYKFDLTIVELGDVKNILYYIDNDEFHSLLYPMKEEGINIGYIHNKKLSYEDWIVHPEKIRYERSEKLQSL